MNILLTGGTGFLGQEFLKAKNKKHRFSATYRKKPGKKLKNVEWVKLDLINPEDFKNASKTLKNIDAIIHAGGATPNRAYADGSFDATTKGTKLLLQLGKKLKIKKFIFISTNCADFPHKGPYADSKRKAEKDVKRSGLNYTIIKPETIIGKNAKDFNRMTKLVQTKRFFPVFGSGNNSSQPISSDDLIEIIDLSLTKRKTDRKSYIAAGNDSITTKEMMKAIAKTNNNKITIIPLPSIILRPLATVANLINPKWGLNNERISIHTTSRKYSPDVLKDFNLKLKPFNEMIDYLRTR